MLFKHFNEHRDLSLTQVGTTFKTQHEKPAYGCGQYDCDPS